MSPRHIDPRTMRARMRLGTLLAGATTIGAAAIALASATPADAGSPPLAATAMRMNTPTTTGSAPANAAAQVPVPGRGTKANITAAAALARPAAKPAAQRADGTDKAPGTKARPAAAPADKGVQAAPTAQDVLKLALSQVGVSESPAGGSKYNAWFMTTPFARKDALRDDERISDFANASWCDMFVTWVGQKSGVDSIGGDAFTQAHAQWFKDNGHWGTTPKPGAVVFFTWNGNHTISGIEHVGLVVKDNHDGTIQTVEGNTSDSVRIRTRKTSDVVGYGYPDYAQ